MLRIVGLLTVPALLLGQFTTTYDSFGHGPRTVVMVQGLGLDRHTWGPFAQLLAQQHRVVVFDARGAGEARDAGAAPSATSLGLCPPSERLHRPRCASGLPEYPRGYFRLGGRTGDNVPHAI